MKVGQSKVVGLRKSENKNGKTVTMLYLVSPFEDWQSEKGNCLGFQCSSEYIGSDINCKEGDIVELVFGRMTVMDAGKRVDKAYVQDVKVVGTEK